MYTMQECTKVPSFWKLIIDGFHGAWLTSIGQESGSVFSAAVCKIQASKRYIKSLPYHSTER